jgi:site-specific DNA recombinase
MMKNGLNVLFYREGLDLHEKSDPSTHLTFDLIASVASYIAANIGAEAKKGMKEKAMEGGLHYKAHVGYLPIADKTDPRGRRRTDIIDKQRAPLVKLAFELFATGKYSLATLGAEMRRRGLTTRPSLRWLETKGKEGRPSRPLSKHTLTGMLHN